jgi:hypothetical protein
MSLLDRKVRTGRFVVAVEQGGTAHENLHTTAGGSEMDFIERIFGVSPGGGSGSLVILIPVTGLLTIVAARCLARQHKMK